MVIESLWVEDAVVGQYLVVQLDTVFCTENLVQRVFCVNTRGFFVPAFERILQRSSLWIPSSRILSRSSCVRKRSSQILKMSYPTASWSVVPANFTTILSTSARETFCTRQLLACPPVISMLKIRASDLGTRTSFSFSLGTETYRVSPG